MEESRSLRWLSAVLQGLVAGVVTIAILALRASQDGGTGVAFADLWTAASVAVAVAILGALLPSIGFRRSYRSVGRALRSESPERDEFVSSSGRGVLHSSGPTVDRFHRFTERARRVLTLAQDEAMRFNHNYISTEHLLLGLIREQDGVAARVLENMNVDLAKVRTAVEFIIGRDDRPVVGEVGLTPRAKGAIELAIDEARRLGHNYIGTEHLLLGLVREGEGIAAGVLESLGVNLDRARAEVLRTLSGGRPWSTRPSETGPQPGM
jgi:hypothetical protein